MIETKTLQTLELNKILERLAHFTSFSAGADLARALRPSVRSDEVKQWQQETQEARALFESKTNIHLGGARDVRDPAIGALRGMVIEPQVLLDIRTTLRRATTIKRTLGRLKNQYPLLGDLVEGMEECTQLQDTIGASIDDNAEIKDSASAKLAIVRRDMKIAFDRLQTKLNRIISSPAKSIYLQEAIITTRNGRYVIPIKADHKGKIPGIVHDSSASGVTLFIEPLETVELNNTWRELQLEEDKEIRRILAALTEEVAQVSEQIVRTVEILAYIDLVFAKANYADSLKAVEPIIVPFRPKKSAQHPGSTITLKGARHPLLSGNVVPLDIEYDDETWVLVITGPNTGGKTVALKTVGLMCLMAQCGLHVPAEDAKLSVFEGIFADIGDEQSIEQSLSTFSSHMTNTIKILDQCDERTLVVLDEVGAGTDPAEGSALARAILSTLIDRRVTTMVTTHHPELKIYGVETPGVRNASVEFDLVTLAPTYRLIIGVPGRSNALAIAKRLGLRDDIIEVAKGMLPMEDLIADDLLDEIHHTRELLRNQNADLTALRLEIESQRDELQVRLDKIEDERRDIINATRRNMENEMDEMRKEIRRLRGDLRTVGLPLENLRAVQAAAEKLSAYAAQPIQNAVVDAPERPDWKPRLGDNVWLATLNAEGVITELDGTDALIQVGTLRVRAKVHELQKRTKSQQREIKRGHVRHYDDVAPIVPRGKSPGLELDLRGQRIEESLQQLESYIDAAYTAGLPFGRIIHGKGTGALRKAVREYVETHHLISKVETGHPNEGGDGVTVIHLAPMT
ncbi:MAG: endonuclease MutS2 [Armatimonadetes bacterium]|nr:endonuclease MutS2 [Anaerolineae bacterium]